MSPVAVADLNGDGIFDVLVGTMGRHLHAVSGRGDKLLWSYEVGAQIRYCSPAVVPLSAHAPLVFVGTGPPQNGLFCLRGDAPAGTHRWLSIWQQITLAR